MRWRGPPGLAALTADCSVSDAAQPITGARNPLEFPVSRSFLRCRGLPRPIPVSGDKSFLQLSGRPAQEVCANNLKKSLVHTPIHISSAVIPRREGFSTGPSTVLSTASRRSQNRQAPFTGSPVPPRPGEPNLCRPGRWASSADPHGCPPVTVRAGLETSALLGSPGSFRAGPHPDCVCAGGAPRSMCDYLPYRGGDVPSTTRELSTRACAISPERMRA